MEDQDIVSAAWAVIGAIQNQELPNRPAHLHPHRMLSALLTHAPTESAKREIAKDIVDNRGGGGQELMAGLIELTDYFWTALLVPCNHAVPLICHTLFYIFLYGLTTLVRSQGGKTPAPSEHPSKPAETFDQRVTTGRLSQREKVLHPSPEFLPIF